MADPIDDAKRALDEVPVPDVWAEAQRRAAAGSALVLDAGAPDRSQHRPARWLAAAAVVLLVAGVAGAVVLDDDDEGVDTGPTATEPVGDEDVAVYQHDGGCALGVAGEPLPEHPTVTGPEDPELYANGATMVSGSLAGGQAYEVQVPGIFVIDLVGERVEDVELARGTAQAWYAYDDSFVQVRWFPGSQYPCESFTVTVRGGSEDANLDAAVAIADRVRLPSELPDGSGEPIPPVFEGTWRIRNTSGDGATELYLDNLWVTLADGHATWSDGCNTFDADYQVVSPTELRIGETSSTERPCPTSARSQAIASVMGADTTTAEATGDELTLSGGGASMVLARDRALEEPVDVAGTGWQLVGIDTEQVVDDGATMSFTADEITWFDGCSDHAATYEQVSPGVLALREASPADAACSGPAGSVADAIGRVMSTGTVEVERQGPNLAITGDGLTIVLAPS